jgi:glycosyltransferase involved in cell wall biosynthesis
MYPYLGVIVTSRIAWGYVSRILGRKDIILIPQHHCNYLRENRDRKEVKVVGIIGSPECEGPNNESFIGRLKEVGLELAICRNPRSRGKVVNFYKNIDIQVVYRPHQIENNMLTSLKLANAGSFGIPTVACPEKSYINEFDGCFLPVHSEEELFLEIKRLKEEPSLYEDLSEKAKAKAEKYNIENIAKLYRQLL